MANNALECLIEERAENGDGAAMVAYALLEISTKLGHLGFNGGEKGSMGPPGTTEKIAIALTKLAEKAK